MELKENKIEFDLQELALLSIADKAEGFRQIGERSSMPYWKKSLKLISVQVVMNEMLRGKITVSPLIITVVLSN